MKQICRLTIAYAHGQTDGDMRAVIQKHMDLCGVTMEDIAVETREAYGGKTHFGNWVLTPVLTNVSSLMLATSMGTQLDMHRYVIEQSDLDDIKIGDKVTLQMTNMIAMQHREYGTVINKADGSITVRKKRSKTKGWHIRVGDESGIWKGWI